MKVIASIVTLLFPLLAVGQLEEINANSVALVEDEVSRLLRMHVFDDGRV